jgi:hypothetical protein
MSTERLALKGKLWDIFPSVFERADVAYASPFLKKYGFVRKPTHN